MISPEVTNELLAVQRVLHHLPTPSDKGWTPNESQRFWMGLVQFPQGPWTEIAKFIGTKTPRQTMTHSQKLRQKLKRWKTRLYQNPAARFLMDASNVDLCRLRPSASTGLHRQNSPTKSLLHLIVKHERCSSATSDDASDFNFTTGILVPATPEVVTPDFEVYTEQSCGLMTPQLFSALRPHLTVLSRFDSTTQSHLLPEESSLDVVVEELGLVM